LDLDKELKPDFASLTLSSLNFEKQASVNSPEVIQQLARKMVTKGIRPELEVFDLGMINYAKYLIRKGILSAPYYFNIILGNIAGAQADLGNLSFMVRELPEQSIWSIGGFGSTQLPMNVAALVAGGGVRVGLEDNIWYDEKKTVLATNIDLIERLLVIARVLEQTPFPVEEARNLLKV
jgi:3-keto-5-aminohexanoate cleavage enzyme